MFREIRKKKKEISIEEIKKLLTNERRGVLSVIGDDGYPYGIPLNYYYDEKNNVIYFHGSRVGHKVDALKKCDKVCFTIYGDEQIVEEKWAPYLKSVVIFGRCHTIDNQDVAIKICKEFAKKYYPNEKLIEKEIQTSGKTVQMFAIEIEHFSGKQIQEK